MAACSPRVVNPNFENDLLTKVAIWLAVRHAGPPPAQDVVDGTAATTCSAVIPNGWLAPSLLPTAVDVAGAGIARAGARPAANRERKKDETSFIRTRRIERINGESGIVSVSEWSQTSPTGVD